MARPRKKKKAAPRRKKTQTSRTGFNLFGRLFALTLKVFPLVLIFALLGGGFWGIKEVLYADPALQVKEIRISPLGALSHDKLVGLEREIMGSNILNVDLSATAQKLEKNPQIRRAAVIREMPSTIKIDVQLRNPIAFMHFSPQKQYALISEDGVILDYVDQENTSLVIIEAYGMGLEKPGIGYQIKNRGFAEATKFLKAYWDDPISERESLTVLSIDPAGAISMKLHDDLEIRLGRQPSTRLATMQKIIHLLEGEARDKIDYIDLQFDNVIVKKK